MVGRRTNQRHARGRTTRCGDRIVHFVTWQFTTFTGLGPLSHFDLNLVRVRQVKHVHAETTRGHLLDRRTTIVTVIIKRETPSILAAFASIALTAQTIHRNRQRLVSFRRNRSKAHRARAKALDDLLCRLHMLQRHRRSCAELEQPAQVTLTRGLLIDGVLETLVRIGIVCPSRMLDVSDVQRVPSVLFTAVSPVNRTRSLQTLDCVSAIFFVCKT